MPILFDHIGYIACLGPEEQVVGVDAARIVTHVQDLVLPWVLPAKYEP